MNTKKVPSSAFSFNEPEACLFKDEEKGNVDIIAYSGKIIKNHWYWGDLAIDVAGTEFAKKLYPILEQHDIMRKIGFSSKPLTDENKLTIKNMTFVDTDASKEFQTISKQGFPFEASISGKPLVIEELKEGESTEVNGYKFKGPGSIWRKWLYNETSVVVFGADSNTRSKALSKDDEEIEVEIKRSTTSLKDDELDKDKEVKTVNLKELKEKDIEAYNALMKEAVEIACLEFAEKEKVSTAKVTEVTTQLADVTKRLAESSAKILSFEKAEAIRKEKEIQAQAEGIWQEKLGASEIPEHLYTKVKAHVSYEKYLKEGVFADKEFAEAVTTEIADWVKGGISKTVLGTSFSVKEPGEKQAADAKADDAWVAEMKKKAGQT